MRVAVLGAGAWGTALSIQAAKAYPVKLWARDSGHVSGMKKARCNPKYLGDFPFPDQLELTSSLDAPPVLAFNTAKIAYFLFVAFQRLSTSKK